MTVELTHSVFKYMLNTVTLECRKIKFQRTNKQRHKVNPQNLSSHILVPSDYED